jgi:hypothetical protein
MESHHSGNLPPDSRTRALWAAKLAFEELAQAFIAHGIPSQMAERLLRAAYVRETAKRVRKGWREDPNVSQISVKTGIDRHLVKAILKNESEALRIPDGRRDPITKVTDGWLMDPRYRTRRGPRDLPVGDRHSSIKSVCSLIERYAPGTSPRLVVDQLLRVNLVTTLPNGKLRWVGSRDSCHFSALTREQETAGSPLRSAFKVLLQNFEPQSNELRWRKVETRALSMKDAPKVRKILRERVENMFSWLTDELSSSRWRAVEQGEQGVRIGILGFTFEESVSEDKKNEQTASQTRSKRNKA